GLPEPPTPLPAARPAVPAVTPGPRSVGLDRQGAHRAGHPAERGRPSPSPLPLPRQRPVVLLDELAELGRHLVRAGEEELLLAAALEGAAERVLELLESLDELRLELLHAADVAVRALVFEGAHAADQVVEGGGVHAGPVQGAAQGFGLGPALAHLAAELADRLRVEEFGPAPGPAGRIIESAAAGLCAGLAVLLPALCLQALLTGLPLRACAPVSSPARPGSCRPSRVCSPPR